MKYAEMNQFLHDNGIQPMQPVIANAVLFQLEEDIPDEEFEEICEEVYGNYLDCSSTEEPDIWYLVDDVLTDRGLKEGWK